MHEIFHKIPYTVPFLHPALFYIGTGSDDQNPKCCECEAGITFLHHLSQTICNWAVTKYVRPKYWEFAIPMEL